MKNSNFLLRYWPFTDENVLIDGNMDDSAPTDFRLYDVKLDTSVSAALYVKVKDG